MRVTQSASAAFVQYLGVKTESDRRAFNNDSIIKSKLKSNLFSVDFACFKRIKGNDLIQDNDCWGVLYNYTHC